MYRGHYLKSFDPEETYTSKTQTMVMIDSSSSILPKARVSIDTSHYTGEVTALCCEKHIMCNIRCAREPACPDEQWVPSLVVQTLELKQ